MQKFESVEPSTLENAVILDKSIKELNKCWICSAKFGNETDIALKAVSFVNNLYQIFQQLYKKLWLRYVKRRYTSLGERLKK